MKNIVFLSVVMLLGSVQRLTAASVEIMSNTPMNEATDELYQGDMVLTDEQRRSLVARKAINDTRYRWPKSADGTVNIDYRYVDTVVSRPGVLLAMSRWEQATCIKFNEIAAQVAKPHLIFITSTTSCNSNVGQVYFQNGQSVNLMPSCFNGGENVVVHELGHALGLWHEQSRTDRDNYLYIMVVNVITGMEHNFNKEDSNNYGLPYDYSSIMQYGPTAFSKNGLNTIVAKDPLAQPLIEDRQGLSFMDKKIVNIMYSCTDTWLAKCNLATDPCQNQGYTKSDCTCECPAGTSGANCETLNLLYIDALISAKSPGSQRITTAGTVTSPGYPTPVTTATTRVQSIEAPACNTVKLTFNVFDMRGLSNLSSDNWVTSFQACWYMILKIKLDDPPITGTEYCGANITATQTFQSVGRFMVLTFSTRNLASNTKTGYSATVEFVPVTTGNCTPTTTIAATSSTTPTTRSTTTPTTISTTTPPTSTTTPPKTSTTTPTSTSTTTPTTTSTTTSTIISTTTPTTALTSTPSFTTTSETTSTTILTTTSTTTPTTTSTTTPTFSLTTTPTTTSTTTPAATSTTTPTTTSTTTPTTTSTTIPTTTPTTMSTTTPTTTSATTPTTTQTTTSTSTPTLTTTPTTTSTTTPKTTSTTTPTTTSTTTPTTTPMTTSTTTSTTTPTAPPTITSTSTPKSTTTPTTTTPTATSTTTPTTTSTTTHTTTPATTSTSTRTSTTTPTTTSTTTPTTTSTTTPTTISTTTSSTTPTTTTTTTPTKTSTSTPISTTTPTTTSTTTPTTTPTTKSTTTPTTTSTTTPTTTSTTTPTTTSTATPTTISTTTSTKTSTTTPKTTTRTTSTTTAATSPGTFINSGRLPLIPSKSSGLCKLISSVNPSVYFYRNPTYPGNYGRGLRCKIWFNTTEPRYLKVTPLVLKLGLSDSAKLFYSYQTTTYLDARKVGTAITLPTSSSRLTVQVGPMSLGGRFDIQVEVVNTGCHQLILLDGRSAGILSIPANYSPGTICEWWLRAPAGRKVQVSFSRFFIGGKKCRRDFVLIDLAGDSRYATKSTRYCGGKAYSPGTVVSTANALNILVNGQRGNHKGLTATYKVV